MNIEREIRLAVDTGKVTIGHRETLRAVKNKEVKLVVVANNCPKELKEDLVYYARVMDVPFFEFEGTSLELGSVCGKPYVISMLGIIDPGESNILELERRR